MPLTPPSREMLDSLRRGALHARMRWLGTGMFLAALLLLGATVVALISGHAPWYAFVIALLSVGMGLATFGLHNDTALATLRPLRFKVDMPRRIGDELDEEVLFRGRALMSLKPTPRMAWAVTMVGLLALTWGFLRFIL